MSSVYMRRYSTLELRKKMGRTHRATWDGKIVIKTPNVKNATTLKEATHSLPH